MPGSPTACDRSWRPVTRSAPPRPRSRSASRWRWCRQTRQGRSPWRTRGTVPTATAVARLLAFAGHDVEREYYYNDARRADGALLRVDRGDPSAGRRHPRTAIAASTWRSWQSWPAIPCRRCCDRWRRPSSASAIHFDTWAKESDVEAEIPEAVALLDTFEEDGARLGTHERAWRRQGSCARALGWAADVLREGCGVHPPEVRARFRPPHLRARGRSLRLRRSAPGTRRDARAIPATRSRC